MKSECTMTEACPGASLDEIRDGIVMLSSDCTSGVKEELEKSGYLILNRTNELIIFSKDLPGAENAHLNASGVFVEAEENACVDSAVTLKGRSTIADWKESFVNFGEDGKPQKYVEIYQTSEMAHAALAFRHGCDRSVPDQTGLRLRLYDVGFGVLKSSVENKVRGFFVTELEVCATPAGSWSSLVKHVAVDPTVNSIKRETLKQDSKTGAATGNAGTAGFSAQYSSSTTRGHSEKIVCFGWEPAVKGVTNNSVKWVWKLTRWDDKSEFSVASSAEWLKSPDFGLRKLPFEDIENVPALSETDDILLEAQWIVPSTDAREILEAVEWDIEVNITAVSIEKGPSVAGWLKSAGYQYQRWNSAKENKSYKSKLVHKVGVA